jgi:hypothetical protein
MQKKQAQFIQEIFIQENLIVFTHFLKKKLTT